MPTPRSPKSTAEAPVAALQISPISSWSGAGAFDIEAQELVESGGVLYCPALRFTVHAEEAHLLDARYSDAKRKSIYLRGSSDQVQGTPAYGRDRDLLAALLARYRTQAMALVTGLFDSYRGLMQPASTSFRPRPTGVGEKSLSWRKDDSRLHVDAFPSNPTHGVRILRVFSNVGVTPRVWRVGEPFEPMARHFLTKIPAYSEWRAQALARIGITKRVRTPYDHAMLHLHDAAKADLDYQQESPQRQCEFAPGSTWICYSDQVMHAAMAGQYMLEQTVHVRLDALKYPERAPLAVLERLMLTSLLPRVGLEKSPA